MRFKTSERRLEIRLHTLSEVYKFYIMLLDILKSCLMSI